MDYRDAVERQLQIKDDPAARLAKVLVELPESDQPPTAESIWATHLGGDLYRLRNSPFYAFDLHFGDVVRATPERHGDLPRVREVVERSGHKTLRVIFAEHVTQEQIGRILDDLSQRATNHEHAQGRLYALDVRPEAEYQSVCNYLWDLQQRGVLHYETGLSLNAAT